MGASHVLIPLTLRSAPVLFTPRPLIESVSEKTIRFGSWVTESSPRSRVTGGMPWVSVCGFDGLAASTSNSSAAPSETLVPAAVLPSALESRTLRTPSATLVVPVYVFALLRISRPGSLLLSVKLPLGLDTTPLIVRFVLAATPTSTFDPLGDGLPRTTGPAQVL